jgi:ATP-dependent RNA helicase RhlE
LPTPRHTLFFSATLSREIEKLIGEFLASRCASASRPRHLGHYRPGHRARAAGADKLDVLHDLLIQPGFDKVLIFGRTKHGVERLSKKLGGARL